MRYIVLILVLFVALPAHAQEGAELIGTTAPEWDVDMWLNSEPISLSDLKGKVILLRWWTGTCPFCVNSGSALNEFHVEYADRGLAVIGMFHPKPEPGKAEMETIKRAVRKLKFKFPIAIDNRWKTLQRYWLNAADREYTSVSFIVDKEGIIRYVHPGPEYHATGIDGHESCVRDYRELKQSIEDLLKETEKTKN